MTAPFNPGKLRSCPECGGRWPAGPDHALRGCGWLGGLSRNVSPMNQDVTIHDGDRGRDRFLHFEIKAPGDWPAPGQARTLMAFARQSNWTVRVLRGTAKRLQVWRVSGSSIDDSGIATHAEPLRRAVDSWLRGCLWRDVEGSLSAQPDGKHMCGWARVDGVWRCAQDYYAIGDHPETSCGAIGDVA